ncbi:echs1 [Symbiodinium necroappetens]|uniref:Echs1 protein n=1 Tax=Symbiodinium necroappetens TaxID=1628268 RepID=A0A813CIX8_9DINO|nr:echs1 [Symbiodinium necroappetens]
MPWQVDGFDKPASCTHKNWRHKCLKYKLGTQCATLELDTGDGANGLNPAVLDALQDAIMDLQDRSDIRVVILKSTGKFFSQGFDPKHLMAESTMSDEDIIAFQTQFAKILYFLQSHLFQHCLGASKAPNSSNGPRCLGAMGGKPSKVPGGAILAIREMNPDGLCFDTNGPMRFKDIFYKKRNLEPGEREFLVDDAQIDRKKAGEQLPFLGQKMEWDEEKKEYKPLEGKKWGTVVKGYDMGKYLWVKREKKWLPKFSGGKRVLVEEIAEVPKEPFIIKFPQWWFPLKRYKSLMVWEMEKSPAPSSLGRSRSSSWSSLPPPSAAFGEEAAVQLLERCGWDATKVRSRCLQGLWSGLGNVYEIECELNGHPAGAIVKLIDWRDASGPWLRRELKTYEVEALFYQTYAQRLRALGACCPELLLLDRSDRALTLAISRLRGEAVRKLSPAATDQALQWLARLHAEFWGVRAEAAVAAGLHDVGCFWSLDNCRDQLSNLPQDGFGQRLLLAADAVDERLKLEPQSICHGDCKDHNMCLHDGIIGMFDFQWTGKACVGKDIAYCLICASGQLTSADEASYLATYHRALSEQLSMRQEPAPTLEQVAACYRLALLDLARWMAGCPYGWWGHGRVLKHAAEKVLRTLDGGEILSSADDYRAALWREFPRHGECEIESQKSRRETDACPKGKVRMIYSGGKSNQNGMSNGPEDESGASAPVHTYHAIKNTDLASSKKYQEAAKKALCEVPPVRLKCEGGKMPKIRRKSGRGDSGKPAIEEALCLQGLLRMRCGHRKGSWVLNFPRYFGRLQQLTVALIQGTAMGAGTSRPTAVDRAYSKNSNRLTKQQQILACDFADFFDSWGTLSNFVGDGVLSSGISTTLSGVFGNSNGSGLDPVKGLCPETGKFWLGPVPATALPYITRRCTFIKNVYQLVLAGANLSSEIAEEYGFVDKVVDEVKDLETECQAVCDRMTLCAPGAVAATKDVVMNTVGVPPSSFMMNYVAGIVADIRAGPECKAGMQAVLNKTRPKWADTPIAP